MSTQMITNPPVLDTTGQAIVAALNNLTEATSPTNVYIDIPLSIPVSGWDDNTPHVYTWMNENIVGNCGIEVGFADGAEDVATTFIRVTKIVGGIKFSVDEVPSAPIPLIVRIINAKADSVIGDIDATMVETSAIPGVTNVEEALTDLDGRVDDNADDIASNSEAIAKVQNGLAHIVGDTNTTGGTLAVGQFVYVKGHSTIAEGLRTVTASISANGNITTSNTSACSDGGLNALNSNKVDLYGGTYFEYTSIDDMQDGLLAMASNIGNNKTAMAVIWPNFSGNFGGAEGCASISVRTPSYFSVLFHNYNGVYYGKYLNGVWTWDSLQYSTINVNSYSTYVSIYNVLDSNPSLIAVGGIGNQDNDGNSKDAVFTEDSNLLYFFRGYWQLV